MADMKQQVEAEVKKFSDFFVTELKNDVLSNSERAILSTYIAWKLGVGQKETDHAQETSL